MDHYVLDRISFLQSALEEIGADAMLVTSLANHRYFTDFNNGDGALLITKCKKYAFEDSRYFEEASKKIGDEYIVFESTLDLDRVKEIVEEGNIRTIAFEGDKISYGKYKRLQNKLENVSFIDEKGLMACMRDEKDPIEIQRIAIAQEITDGAFAHILKTITPTMTENDVAAELEYYMRKHGAEDKSRKKLSDHQ